LATQTYQQVRLLTEDRSTIQGSSYERVCRRAVHGEVWILDAGGCRAAVEQPGPLWPFPSATHDEATSSSCVGLQCFWRIITTSSWTRTLQDAQLCRTLKPYSLYPCTLRHDDAFLRSQCYSKESVRYMRRHPLPLNASFLISKSAVASFLCRDQKSEP